MTYDLNSIDGGFLREEGGLLSLRSDIIRDMGRASDRELLSILLPGARSCDIESVVRDMYKPGFDIDFCDIPDEMRKMLDASIEIGRRLGRRKSRILLDTEDIYREVRHFASDEKETCIVVALSGGGEMLKTYVVSVGLLNKAVIHPREVFSDAIRLRAAVIVIAHNHPSGSIEPSQDDKDITARLVKAGQLLGIRLLDHLIFTDERYYSFREHGLI